MVEREISGYVKVKINGETHQVPERITVKSALELAGYEFTRFPEKNKIFAPCEVGGCWSCAVEISGRLKPSCVTPVQDGMIIKTDVPRLKRLVHGFSGHTVGGVGTPWWLKGRRYIEAACFACGCNLRCPQCQNWTTTYCGKDIPMTPFEAARKMTALRKLIGVDRMAISGGECTLNREWLISYIRELRRLNPDREARFHVDTNATIVTPDYIDELVEAGMTDIGIDIKALHLDTFLRITGVGGEIGKKYLKTSWMTLKYVLNEYGVERVFVGVGIPYNPELIALDEIREIGEKISGISTEVQVCALDYRAEFRSKIKRPSFNQMYRVWGILKDCGLKNVVCQTMYGYINPEGRVYP
jgi:pyruvate formate lyase activating enzyme